MTTPNSTAHLQGAEIHLANPRGFCAGVERAIEIVERALEIYGAPIYVRHEVVHNRFVVEGLKDKGVVFVEELDEVPDDVVVIFSAHGVPQVVRTEAERRALQVFDATCPLVTKVHLEVARHEREGRECVLIGHAGHPEVEGTLGQFRGKEGQRMYLVESVRDAEMLEVPDPDNLAFVTQTTLSIDDTVGIIDALRARFPNILGPRKDDICYATQNRQDAVKDLVGRCDIILVVGSRNSSNSNRLRELPERAGLPAYLIDEADEIDPAWFTNRERIGVTAGASVPENLVQEVIERLESWGARLIGERPGHREDIVFSLPRALQR
ncbi:MAG: 4-hydroxy-3-methylbut-2-enyl diphosphate reductase [Gammaproteobacteria bacterium]|nr:4-hydroxy-3-methylbut-2-enyl diphosphate reductase [Gammaproteobacteria bacterium]